MARLEASVEQDFAAEMRAAEWLDLKGDHVKRGYSDRFFFGYGPRTVVVEFKRDGAREGRRGEKLQDYYRNEFRQRGYECYKVETQEEAEELCQVLCEANRVAKKEMLRRSS